MNASGQTNDILFYPENKLLLFLLIYTVTSDTDVFLKALMGKNHL